MQGRPTILFPLALLGLLALLTLWIDHTVQAPEQKAPGNDRHDPDYFLDNFVTSKTDVNGVQQYVLAAIKMTHYPDNDSTLLDRPHFTMYGIDKAGKEKPTSQIEGQKGIVSTNGEVVEFMDNVRIVRAPFQDRGEMVVLTEYMKIYPKKNMATTEKPVLITQAPGTIIRATGMIYDKEQQTVTLLNRVRAHYEKPGLTKPGITKNSNTVGTSTKQSAGNSKLIEQADAGKSSSATRKIEKQAATNKSKTKSAAKNKTGSTEKKSATVNKRRVTNTITRSQPTNK